MFPLVKRRNDLEDLPTVLELFAGRRLDSEQQWMPLRILTLGLMMVLAAASLVVWIGFLMVMCLASLSRAHLGYPLTLVQPL